MKNTTKRCIAVNKYWLRSIEYRHLAQYKELSMAEYIIIGFIAAILAAIAIFSG